MDTITIPSCSRIMDLDIALGPLAATQAWTSPWPRGQHRLPWPREPTWSLRWLTRPWTSAEHSGDRTRGYHPRSSYCRAMDLEMALGCCLPQKLPRPQVAAPATQIHMALAAAWPLPGWLHALRHPHGYRSWPRPGHLCGVWWQHGSQTSILIQDMIGSQTQTWF